MNIFSAKTNSRISRLIGVYIAEAVICLLAAVMSFSVDTWDVLVFPYGQIGSILRWLSFGGAVGNIAAWILFVLISLIPAAVWAVLKQRKAAAGVDAFLPVCSLLLFFILYMAVNPALLFDLTGVSTGVATASILLASFALVMDSIVILYLVLRMMHCWRKQENGKLIRNLKYFFCLLGFVLVIMIFAQAPSSLLGAVENVKEGNTGLMAEVSADFNAGYDSAFHTGAFSGDGHASFGQTWFLLILKMFVDYLPAAAELILSILAVDLLESMEKDMYSEETVKKAGLLARVCSISLIGILGFLVCCNVLNLLLLPGSLQTSLLANIPLSYIGFSMILLLISRNLSSGRELKQDYDLFI